MTRTHRVFFLLFAVFVVCFSISNPRMDYFSDEASYFSIAQSIAFDGDLEYTGKDIRRIRRLVPTSRGPMGLFLKKARDGRIFYAKSYAYPLFAAPFLLLFGVRGVLLFNGVMLWLILWAGYHLVRRFHDSRYAFGFTLCFFLASIVPVYIWWMQPALFNLFSVFMGMFFFFYPFRRFAWLSWLSPVFFSFAVFSKPSALLPVVVLYLLLLYRREFWKFFLFSLISILFTSGLFMVNKLYTGEFNYQGGDRKSFHQTYPFESPDQDFGASRIQMSSNRYWERQTLTLEIVLLNLFYFIFGKFTGFFIYFFPAFFVLFLFFFQRKEREDWFLFFSILAGIFFFVVVTPNNYFGGSGSVGNRYFFSLYPYFFFLGLRHRIRRFVLAMPVMALILLNGPFLNSKSFSQYARSTGLTFPVNLFPVEKTQYRALPTNENPRAFGRPVRVGKHLYHLYFLNNNFFALSPETSTFHTFSDRRADVLIRTPRPVREFVLELQSPAENNRATVQVEYRRRRLRLPADQAVTVTFRNLPGLYIDKSWIYLLKVRSHRGYIPRLNPPHRPDTGTYGVRVKIIPRY